ncbi:unnamed protein product [Ceutorhynchus assimilis]|uniref:Tonsoku-like protein n=1 Tax=Ceutorhynchus assimilis TaxID=467358 RepID=A0A9N9M9Z1_9CUCU|nr:unnamed protein product [Ceutorhynchus assimilis]
MEEQKLFKKKQKAAGNDTALASACHDLASFYIKEGKFEKAIEEYKVLLNIYKDQNQRILYGLANRGIAEAYMSLQQYDQSKKYFMVYHDVAVEENDTLEEQRALAQLGHMYLTRYLDMPSTENKYLLNKAYKFLFKSMDKCQSLANSTEKQDMLARLISNLGLVKENLGDYETAYTLYKNSIKICKNYDFYEQLYRGYLSMASIFEKQDKYQETIKNINLAIEAAKKLSSKRVELICAALLSKSETLIKIADFQGAKQALRKAYKFKTVNKEDQRCIETKLRIVAGMCKIEDDIIACSVQTDLKNLYEKMGDGACALKNYKKAVEYYKKMLEAAERNGASEKELGECYFSLGETYKDIGNFQEAEIYYEKEYALCKNNFKESLNTICKIADLKEIANNKIDQIRSVYERLLSLCRENRNLKEERRIVLRYMDLLKRNKCFEDVFGLEERLKELDGQIGENKDDSSSSSDECEDSEKIHIGNDIVLSDITDNSEESDNEVPALGDIQSSKRRKQNAVAFKKNEKGESPLHVACIKNSKKMVIHWLGLKHPVNVRDNAGWSPLHEAALHACPEIVQLLLDAGASINDRGGPECFGVTPLHDAAGAGNLEVVELLLDRGAAAVAKTDDGNTPLYELKKWYDRTNKNCEGQRLHLYNRLVERLEQALERAGQNDVKADKSNLSNKENVSKNSQNARKLRRNIPYESEEGTLESLGGISLTSSSDELLVARRKFPNVNSSKVSVNSTDTNRPAHIHQEDLVCVQNVRKSSASIPYDDDDSEEETPGSWESISRMSEKSNSDEFLRARQKFNQHKIITKRPAHIHEDDFVHDQSVRKSSVSIPYDDDNSEEETPGSWESTSRMSEKSSSDEYCMVMQQLRHNNPCEIRKRSPVNKPSVASKRPHIYEDDFGCEDKWLENDIRPSKTKKRKINSNDLILNRGCLNKSPMKTGINTIIDGDQDITAYQIHDLPEFDANIFESTTRHRRDSAGSNDSDRSSLSLRRTQATLLDSGFSCERNHNANSTKLKLKRSSSGNISRSLQPKIRNYAIVEADSTSISRSPVKQSEVAQEPMDSMLYVDVEIEGKAFRIPVLMSETKTKTIKWLSEQAAHRYESKQFMRPILELETVTGVILGDCDLVSLLFPLGSMQAERVVGKVIEWNLPSLLEKYRAICSSMSADPNEDVCSLIQNVSINLNISDRAMPSHNLNPLLKSINNQKCLTKINLSGNSMSAYTMTLLCSSIITLPELQSLNLSCTSLLKPYLNHLASTISTHSALFKKMVNLDLSDNIMLQDDCFDDIIVISNALLQLQSLNLSNIGLKNLPSNSNMLSLKCLENLDLSYNKLSDNDLMKVLSSLDASLIKILNISRNKGQNILRRILDLFENESNVFMKEIGLEMCGINDSDLYELLRTARNITHINLSHNSDLTSISLRRLLEHGNLSCINVVSCDNIWDYFDAEQHGWNIAMQETEEKAQFKVSGKNDLFLNSLVEMFRTKFKHLETVKSGSDLLVKVHFSRN